jgi:dihydrofolate reductase/thymidylate synthase
MFEVILACTKNYGIGKNNSLPWNIPEDLRIFKEKTMDSVLIMGRKTAESLHHTLERRNIICIGKSQWTTQFTSATSFENALEIAEKFYVGKKIFVAGGAKIYDTVFRKYLHLVSKLHISIMNEMYSCDTFISELNLEKWGIIEEKIYPDFKHYVMTYSPGESQYLDLIKSIPKEFRNTRNGNTASVFGKHISFNLAIDGFPLLTTKKMFFRGIVEELLFFLRGDTNTKLLEEKNINIWKGNTSRVFLDSIRMQNRKEGMMGPMYGYQFRFFNAKYDENTGKNLEPGIDQLALVVKQIRNEPTSRRIIMTSFNPAQAYEGVLYPCHSLIIQFYVNDNNLDMFCYNRSQDLFLGTPFNIASSALLLILVAKITNKIPGNLHMSLGDVHIYSAHYEVALEQTKRQPYVFPTLTISKDIKEIEDIEKLTYDDFSLNNYKCHPAIKADMIA